MEYSFEMLAKEAIAAMKGSYSPYSGFCVGAALLSKNGKIYTGTNIENASYTPTVCAERVAFFKAVSEGEREFVAIAVAGGKDGRSDEYCYPCGVCRQVMLEFCEKESFRVIFAKNNEYEVHTLAELVPFSFGMESLE